MKDIERQLLRGAIYDLEATESAGYLLPQRAAYVLAQVMREAIRANGGVGMDVAPGGLGWNLLGIAQLLLDGKPEPEVGPTHVAMTGLPVAVAVSPSGRVEFAVDVTEASVSKSYWEDLPDGFLEAVHKAVSERTFTVRSD